MGSWPPWYAEQKKNTTGRSTAPKEIVAEKKIAASRCRKKFENEGLNAHPFFF